MAETCRFMKNKDILVTIEVPIWNGEPFIERCITSILAQTHRNIEVIVHDNGSDDNTYNLLQKYIDGDPRFTIVKVGKKQAADPSRNEATRMGKGEYICYLDVDDHIDPTYVEKLLNAVVGHDFAYCDWLKFFPGGSTEERRAIRDDDKGTVFDRENSTDFIGIIIDDDDNIVFRFWVSAGFVYDNFSRCTSADDKRSNGFAIFL